jgi:hypothetical protein
VLTSLYAYCPLGVDPPEGKVEVLGDQVRLAETSRVLLEAGVDTAGVGELLKGVEVELEEEHVGVEGCRV